MADYITTALAFARSRINRGHVRRDPQLYALCRAVIEMDITIQRLNEVCEQHGVFREKKVAVGPREFGSKERREEDPNSV